MAGEQDLYLAEMATGQDREAEDTRIRQLRRVDPSVGTPSGTLAQGNTLRRRHRLGLRLGKDARQDASVWRNAGSGLSVPSSRTRRDHLQTAGWQLRRFHGSQGHAFWLSQSSKGRLRLPERGKKG